MQQMYFITGTDTGVGKTVLTVLLALHLRERGVKAVALKPVCSGGRDDARGLHTAMHGALTLNEINPWHFRAPIAPMLAARRAQRQVRLAVVQAYIRAMQKRFAVVLVEGAGGLLSPLGENFDSRDLLVALRATPVVVGPNRIGAASQVRLTLEALPRPAADRASVVLMSPAKPDASTKINAGLIAEYFDAKRIFELPWLGRKPWREKAVADVRVQRTLNRLMGI